MRGIVCALMLAACGASDGTIDVQRVLLDFEDEAGVTFADCGSFAYGQCFGSDPDEAGAACLTDAFITCSPARYAASFPTVEGDPIVTRYYIVPEGDGCKVVAFRDTTADAFGPHSLVREDCTDVQAFNTCPGVTLAGCEETDRWGDPE